MRKQGYEGRYGKRYTERKNRRKKVRIQRITLLGTAVLTACLIAVGGNVDGVERSSYGTECEKAMERYYPDVAFLSINAINYRDGFTDFRFSEIGIIQILAEKAKEVIAVMDSSKIGKRSRAKALSLQQVDRIISDDAVSDAVKEQYRKYGLLIE